MTDTLVCWSCGQPLVAVILPFSRREECATCGADQHVCKLCRHYKPAMADACNEDRAEVVSDKERANFCDYFDPMPNAYQHGGGSSDDKAKRELAALFGDALAETEDQAEAKQPMSESNAALSELEKLFNKD